MASKDTLGDRIKRYEAASKPLLSRRTPVMVRIDGKAFHTFTRGCEKPFDKDIVTAMAYATKKTSEHIQGFKLAYVQSDEASFLITDYDTLETSAWFDYELNKIVSITASYFTYFFNKKWQQIYSSKYVGTPEDELNKEKANRIAVFDARAFNVPHDDWQNVFIWRQQDWERNSVQMLGRSLHSQNELHGENVLTIKEMSRNLGHDWDSLPLPYKWGTFIKADGHTYFGKADYNKMTEMAGLDV